MPEKNIFASIPNFELTESQEALLKCYIKPESYEFVVAQIIHYATMHGLDCANAVLKAKHKEELEKIKQQTKNKQQTNQ
jgi:hypothetical protein